jgi:phosphatidate cytidylyltransferase
MNAMSGVPQNVAYATAAIYAVLILASLIVLFLRFRNPGERYQELADRTESWWWMIGAFTACVLFNQTVAVIFLAFISYLALKEYLSARPER